jgi:hypothetical protein
VRQSREGKQGAAETGGSDRAGKGHRSRRGLLATGVGVVSLAAAETVGRAAPAQASNGQPVLLGVTNDATAVTEIYATSSSGIGQAKLGVPDSGAGLVGIGTSVGVSGQGDDGTNAYGVQGVAYNSGTGVIGVAGAPAIGEGVGVTAQHTSGGTALQVIGKAAFSRSGTLTIKAGDSAVTLTGVALTAASMILATLQNDVPGVYVQSAVPDVSEGSFTIHLSKAVPTSTTVAWFVVN